MGGGFGGCSGFFAVGKKCRSGGLCGRHYRDVFEPLSLLVEWMQEKYSAELVEYNRGGTGTGIFKTEADEDYLESRVSSVRLKFIWKK